MYKLIFLDYNMQEGMNGPETSMLLRQIQSNYEAENPAINFTRPYICCLTANSGKRFRDEAKS